MLQHTVDNEVSALAKLTFYENLLIGQETSACCQARSRVSTLSGFNLENLYGLFPGKNKTVRKNEVSVLGRCKRRLSAKRGSMVSIIFQLYGIQISPKITTSLRWSKEELHAES